MRLGNNPSPSCPARGLFQGMGTEQEFPHGKGPPGGGWSLHPCRHSKEFLDVEGIPVGIGHTVTLETALRDKPCRRLGMFPFPGKAGNELYSIPALTFSLARCRRDRKAKGTDRSAAMVGGSLWKSRIGIRAWECQSSQECPGAGTGNTLRVSHSQSHPNIQRDSPIPIRDFPCPAPIPIPAPGGIFSFPVGIFPFPFFPFLTCAADP